MKKKWIVITVITLVILAALTFVLPQEIPISLFALSVDTFLKKVICGFLHWQDGKKRQALLCIE